MADDLHSGTAAGLLRFLEYAGEKGLMNATTAGARRSACIKILEIDGEGWRDQKVAELDPEAQFERFSRKSGGNYSPGSLATYGQRFRDAVAQYRDFLSNPTGFRGPRARRTAKESPSRESQTRPSPDAGRAVAPAPSRAEELITYPFPLQNGALGYVQLPRQISESDVARLCDFIRSLALSRPADNEGDEKP